MAREKKEKKEEKKTARRAPAPRKKQERTGALEYFKGVRLEMKKVVWPTKKELISYTIVVFMACTFFALIFWGIDSGFLYVLQRLLGITMG